jgi:flagellar biosynthesis/type III secretory pathway protein FliH
LQTDSFIVLRALQEELKKLKKNKEVTVTINPSIFEYLSSVAYNSLLGLEKKYNIKITLATDQKLAKTQYKFTEK